MAEETLKFIKGKCVLGAILADEGGFIGEFNSRTRAQKDANNLTPQTWYQRAQEGEPAQRLKSISQSGGGVIPQANPFIGAPMSSFVYGGIGPEEIHPLLPLIKGPSKSVTFEHIPGVRFTYDPVFSSVAKFGGASGDGSPNPAVEAADRLGTPPRPQYPTIPSTTGGLFNATDVHSTYNIWNITNVKAEDKKRFTYIKNQGINFGNAYEGPVISQAVQVDGVCYVSVAAPNTEALVERLFPISLDLAYEDNVKLYYPPSGNFTPEPKVIQAKGGDNCGFQIKFNSSSAGQNTNQNSEQLNAGITITWGTKSPPQKTSYEISLFELVLIPNSLPEGRFYHPEKKSWEKFPLNGPMFGSGEYQVFVHFVGPQMLIGFDPDPSGWNAFVPLDDDTEGSKYFYPHIPAESTISLLFDNISATFAYGPIAFNNYHPENVASTSDLTDNKDQGRIPVNFSAPESKEAYLDESGIDDSVVNNAYVNRSSDPNNFEGSASYYADWRSANARPVYSEVGRVTVDSGTGKNTIVAQGEVRFNTTIEGPVLLQVKNSQATGGGPAAAGGQLPRQPSGDAVIGPIPSFEDFDQENIPLILPLDPWGDISKYLLSFSINYQCVGDNRSRLTGTANIVLSNMNADPTGRQILNALNSNKLGVTLSAGYEETETFFQGQIKDIETEYSASGTTITLIAEDVATALIDKIPFRQTLFFASMQYGKIIETAIQSSGLYDWYYQETGNQQFQDALGLRLGFAPAAHSLATQILQATPFMKINEIIDPVLNLVTAPEGLPIFHWKPQEGLLRLDWRNNPEYMDELYFVGFPDPENQYRTSLANSNVDGVHGVLSDRWKERTNLNQLHAGLVLQGRNYYQRVITFKDIDPDAFSREAYEKLKLSVGDEAEEFDTDLGYVGARILLTSEVGTNLLPDQNTMDIYGRNLMRHFLRKAYSTIEFQCSITKPLKHYGQFYIKTFTGTVDEEGNQTDKFFYKETNYQFDNGNGTLTANVIGERFPSFVLKSAGGPTGPTGVVDA